MTKLKENFAQTLSQEQQERSLFAIVASGLRMASGEAQDPMRAMVRMRDGSMNYIRNLPVIDKENPQPNGDYVIPLVNDHNGTVAAQAGACWLYVEDNMLHALIVFSSNTAAADAEPLARDGFLQFSTEGYLYEQDDDGTYGDFWITAVSPVTVGNDPATQVTGNELDELVKRINSLEEAIGELSEQNEIKEEIMTVETVPTIETAPVVEQPVEAKPKLNMASPEAVKAFSNAIAKAVEGRTGKAGVAAAMDEWRRQNEITGDALLPSSIAETFFKAWLDNENLSAFRFMNARAGAVYAFLTADTAKGFLKGQKVSDVPVKKTSQELESIRRDLKALSIYKRLDIDKQDLFDDHSGELVKFRAQELASRITNQILVAALLGGQYEGSVAHAGTGSTRGLFGIMDDAVAVSDDFADAVATKVEGEQGEDVYSAVVRTIGSIVKTANGNVMSAGRTSNGVTLFVPFAAGGASFISQLLLTQNDAGNYIFSGANLEELLRVSRIVEVPELADSGAIIAVADGAYQLYGENSPSMYPVFDIDQNKDQLLAEQFVAGSLAGYKQAAVYIPYEAEVTPPSNGDD